MIEVMVLITYLFTFIVANYGPDPGQIGNVLNEHVQYTKFKPKSCSA